MQPTSSDAIEIQGTPTHLIIRVARSSLKRHKVVLKENGKPIATLTPVIANEYEKSESPNGVHERPTSASSFPEFEQEISAFEALKPELLKQYPGQAVAIFQGKVIATGKNKMEALRNAEKQMGAIRCYVEWVEPETPRRVISPSAFIKR